MRILPIALPLAFLLSGCSPNGTPAIPVPEPTSAPVFASDEDALAAAKVAYGEYLAISDLISQQGGVNPDRLKQAVTPELLAHQVDFFGTFARSGQHQVGLSTITNVKLERLDDDGHGNVTVTIYACTDFSGTRFLDSVGQDVTPTMSRAATLELEFYLTPSSPLIMSSSGLWSGQSIC